MTEGVYRLYGRANAGSLAVQMVLEEIGVPYELIWVGQAPEELEAFRRINPAGKVPALVVPDGTPVCESAAILIYLTGAHPAPHLAPPVGSTAYARFLQWMVFLSANVYDTALRYYYCERYSTAGTVAADGIRQQAAQDYWRQLELVHNALSPYLLGETLSAADPYLYMLVGWFPGDATRLQNCLPKLARHAELLRRRPATVKSDKDHAASA